ncbi:MAG TPA: VWA domain-containing protein [Ilumatobacteraceae bacterium]
MSALSLADPRGATPAERMAVAFARILRGAELGVPIGSVLMFVEALGEVGVSRRASVYWAARSTLVHHPEDLEIFDRAFAAFWDQAQVTSVDDDTEVVQITLATDEESEDDNDDESATASDEPTLTLRFSPIEVLRNKDFGAYDETELKLAQELMSRLRFAGPPRRSFRSVPAARRGAPDLRKTLRSAIGAGGEPIRRHWREPGDRLRRLVLLLDVSGSMEPYARAMLHFVHAAVAGRQRVEAFSLGTRLTRVTKELNSRDPDRALKQASERVQDWSGGTRLGECLRQFNDQWGVRGMARGAIVVILSDGWDRGDPAVLGEQMSRLQRVTYDLIWVTPLKVTPGYAPLARGMAAALPYVDHFVEGHSLAAMEELANVIAGVSARRA